ncbi:MAG: HEAT repeat domain-containing protein [Candidatus Magnetomorum sp.]|nr:HEAT repeat domain-containing protein [Candidatus Magnetomorum sp.]
MEIKTCIENICNNDPRLQIEAIEALRDIDFSALTECLLQLLENNPEMAVKEKVFLLLKSIAFPRTNIYQVERMFKSDEPFIRNATIEILRQADADFLSTMSRLSQDPDKDIRKFVLDTLVEHSSREAIEIVKNCLNDSAPIVRQAAIESLGNMGIRKSAPAIERQLDIETNLMIQCTCLEALATMKHSPNSKDIIERFSKEQNPMLMFSFVRYLGTFGSPLHLELLEKFVVEKGNMILQQAATAATGILNRFDEIVLSDRLIQTLRDARAKQSNPNRIWDLTRAILLGLKEKGLDEARKLACSEDESEQMAAREYLQRYGLPEDQKDLNECF